MVRSHKWAPCLSLVRRIGSTISRAFAGSDSMRPIPTKKDDE
jgi:hypothetical protein